MIQLAIEFAKEKHKDQKRKYTGEPYFNHCAEVAELIKDVAHNEAGYFYTEEVIAAAYLHDVVEDTDATIEDIKRIFGKYVAKLVSEVTDVSKPSDGNRFARKEIDRVHLMNASPEGQSIKLADLISNTKSIVKHDANFAKVYLVEKDKLLDVLCKKGNLKLYHLARETLKEAKKELSLREI
jgi:(p)ppGpp synthase/HD superfamily hydrolase